MAKLLSNIRAGLILITIVFGSCAPMERIGIQVSVPPRYKISEDINSLLLLNRSLNRKFVNMKQDSAEHINRNLKHQQLFYDSIASDSALLTAAKAIFYSQRFDVVVPVHRNIWRDDSSDVLQPLDTTFINDLCENYDVDAVLVLENFKEEVKVRFEMPFRRVFGNLDLSYKAGWRLYQPGQGAYILNLPTRDNLYWYGGLDRSRIEGLRQLPSIREVLAAGGYESGLSIADQICPLWIDQYRFYYKIGDKKIDAAIDLIKSDKWVEASEIWAKYSTTSSASLRRKIEYNLALSEEMKGNIDLAVNWCKKSIETKPTENAKRYYNKLQIRQNELKKEKSLLSANPDSLGVSNESLNKNMQDSIKKNVKKGSKPVNQFFKSEAF